MRRRLPLSVFFVVVFSGCSAFLGSSAPLDLNDDSPEPFKLEVLEEANDGEKLHVKSRLTPRTDWPADSVVVRLKGMKDGKVLDFANFTPQSIGAQQPKAMLLAGKPIDFNLAVENEGLSEYQVELLWGNEAVQYRQIIQGENRPPTGVNLKDVRFVIEPQLCGLAKCRDEFAVLAELCNNSARELTEVVLGLRLSESATEEEIAAEQLGLLAGESRPLRIKIPGTGGQSANSPQLRIVSYKFR